MDLSFFIDKMINFLKEENTILVGKEVSALKVSFEDAILEAERKDQINFLESIESGNNIDKFDFKPIKDKFYSLYKEFQEKKKKQIELKSTLEIENLRLKKGLISRLKEVIENEEKIGNAFNSYKEIHENWKKIGDIPREKRDEIQKEYSRLLELFFYNIKIYKELKDHDLKRNYQLKIDLIFKLKKLRSSNLILRDLESALRVLQDEWEEIGPVSNDQWGELKAEYWEVVRTIYGKINFYFEQHRNSQVENLSKKKLIIEALDKILETQFKNNSIKEWENDTKSLINLQEKWKTIGNGTRKDDDELWRVFRSKCDLFFNSKKQFFSHIEAEHKLNFEAKKKLIYEIDLLKISTDWKETSNKIIKLQNEWKTIGSAGHKWESKLWLTFRTSCQEFFNAKENYFQSQDITFAENLKAKNQLLDEINNYVIGENKQESINKLKEFSQQFVEIGYVPRNQADKIYKKFKLLMDEKYSSIKLDEFEREKINFQAKIESLLLSPERNRLLKIERAELRKQKDQLLKDIAVLENNIGFFSKSKGSEKMKLDVEKKVKLLQDKILSIKEKISMLPNE